MGGTVQSVLRDATIRTALRDHQFKCDLEKILSETYLDDVLLMCKEVLKGKIRFKTSRTVLDLNKIRHLLKSIIENMNIDYDEIRALLINPYFYEEDKSVIPIEVLIHAGDDICV